MILKFGAQNYFCFKEGIEISFELNSNCPESVSKGKEFTNILCVKGANGSGKTNALKILSMLNDFCCDSFSYKPDDELRIDSFFNSEEPSELFIEFMISNVWYRYELVATKNTVVSESLYRKNKRLNLIFKRQGSKITKCIKELSEIKVMKLRSNASFISTAFQYEIDSISSIYYFFKFIHCNVNFFGLTDGKPHLDKITKFYYDHKETFEFVKNIICKCDLGIDDIDILVRKDENDFEKFFPIFKYKLKASEPFLTYYTQSSGTKSLFDNLGIYHLVLNAGGMLVMDEFDINLHPHILPMLLQLFIDKKINKNDAQLIFTTHNSEVINFLGKYRTVLINKEDNESFGYRLDEIPGDMIRNDRLISPLYDDGKLGGVPKL